MNNNYYISAGKKLLLRFDRNSDRFRNALKFYIKDQDIDEIVNKSKQEFESLIPEIPYIGGNSDRYTKDLIYCTVLLAVYKVLKRKRYNTDMIG